MTLRSQCNPVTDRTVGLAAVNCLVGNDKGRCAAEAATLAQVAPAAALALPVFGTCVPFAPNSLEPPVEEWVEPANPDSTKRCTSPLILSNKPQRAALDAISLSARNPSN
ncbi:hypothetical protein KEM54_004984, partial [Ascosphaera aggregata]